MDCNTTLADLLALNLHECEDEVKNIVDKAVKEMSMEKVRCFIMLWLLYMNYTMCIIHGDDVYLYTTYKNKFGSMI